MFYTLNSKITVNLQIRQNPAPAGLEKNKSGTALILVVS